MPSASNPRLAGGMHWSAQEYLEFLDAFYNEAILNSDLINQMTSSQRGGATVEYSPIVVGLGEDWHYCFGDWIEEVDKVSLPGAYGAYPFIDYENRYYGIVARQGSLGTFTQGVDLFRSVSDKLEIWAAMECN